MFVCRCVCTTCVPGPWQPKEGFWCPGAGVIDVINHAMWVIRSEPGTSARAARAPHCWAVSPVPKGHVQGLTVAFLKITKLSSILSKFTIEHCSTLISTLASACGPQVRLSCQVRSQADSDIKRVSSGVFKGTCWLMTTEAEPATAVHPRNLSPGEVETGGSRIQSQHRLHEEFKAGLGYTKPCI